MSKQVTAGVIECYVNSSLERVGSFKTVELNSYCYDCIKWTKLLYAENDKYLHR